MGDVTVVVALRLVFLTAQSIERHMIVTIRRYCAYLYNRRTWLSDWCAHSECCLLLTRCAALRCTWA